MEKKNTGLVVIIIILSLMVVSFGGFIVYDKMLSKNDKIENNEKKEETKIEENDTDVKEDDSINVNFTDKDLNDLYSKVFSLYGYLEYFTNCTWKDENNECFSSSKYESGIDYMEISNYYEVMNSILTENGIKEYENVMLNDFRTRGSFKKENNKVYMKSPTSGIGDSYYQKNLKIKSIENNLVTASIEYGFSDEAPKTKEYTFKIINQNGKWLIDNFPWAEFYFN